MPATLTRSCVAALALIAVDAPTADAAKHNPKKKKEAVYRLQLKGSEAVAWTYKAPPDACSDGAVGNGGQEVSYNTREIKVKAVRSTLGERDGLIQLATLDDQVAQYGASQGIPAIVRVERDGEVVSHAQCGGTGGSTQQPPPKDCGVRYGRITLEAGWHNVAAFDVGGHYDNFAHPAPGQTDDLVPPVVPPPSGDILGGVYANCPIVLPGASAASLDELTDISTHINERRLPMKGKTLKISAGDQDETTDPDGQRTSQTSVAWNLKLKRIK